MRRVIRFATALVLAVPLALSGCSGATAVDPVDPTVLEIPPVGAAVAQDSLQSPEDEDYFAFTVDAEYGSVTVMTTGTTDTAGQVETADRTPVIESCDRDDPRPSCVFSYHADGPVSPNFTWIGRLAAGTYYVRVTAQRQSAGNYEIRVATWGAAPEPPFAAAPMPLAISPDAAAGPDYFAEGSIDEPGQVDYYELVLNQTFNTVTIMTSGPTDTAGQVETELRVPITRVCVGIRPEAAPPCVWGSDADIDTPNPERSAKFNSMAASKNFMWEGKLATGTYHIRVAGQNGSTGSYALAVETANMSCPATPDNPFGYYCDD